MASALDSRHIFWIVNIPERIYFTFLNRPIEPIRANIWFQVSPALLSGFLFLMWCVISSFRYLAGRSMDASAWLLLGTLGSLCMAASSGVNIFVNLQALKFNPMPFPNKAFRLCSVIISCSFYLLCIISSILMTEFYTPAGKGGSVLKQLSAMRMSLFLEAFILSVSMAFSIYFGLKKPTTTYC